MKIKFLVYLKNLTPALIFFCNPSFAEPFDKTGLIDLKNEASARGSCVAIGSRLMMATGKITNQIFQRPAQDQYSQLQNTQDAQKINKFGRDGLYWAKALQQNVGQHVPLNEINDFYSVFAPTVRRFDQAIARDPWLGVEAWNACGEAYGFLK